MHETEAGNQRGAMDRRRALGVVGAGAAAAWVAPSIRTSAAAAAGTTPGCADCDQGNLLINGGAETGALAPWISGPPPFAVETWTDLAALGLTPPAGAGDHAFAFIVDAPGVSLQASMFQVVNFGAGCESALVSVSADLSALASADAVSMVVATVDFRNSASTSLGPGTVGALGLTATPGLSPTAAVPSSTSGFMPAGAVSVQISAVAFCDTMGGANGAVAVAAIDNISLTLSCLA